MKLLKCAVCGNIVEMIEGARLNRRQQMLLDRIREDGKA